MNSAVSRAAPSSTAAHATTAPARAGTIGALAGFFGYLAVVMFMVDMPVYLGLGILAASPAVGFLLGWLPARHARTVAPPPTQD